MKLKETDKAKPLKIIFNHETYFVEARKNSGNCGEILIYKKV
jgi:hypothetical protein